MWNCEKTKTSSLEYLYGLLEEPEAAEFKEHLSQCGDCSKILARTNQQIQVLSKASKISFPNISFTPPAGNITLTEVQSSTFTSARLWMWSLAAAVLVLLGIPGGIITFNYQADLHRLQESEKAIALAAQKMDSKARALQAVLAERNSKIREASEEIRKKELRVVVTGPQTIQPGAPNQYQILTRDNLNRPVDAKIDAFVEDQSNPGNRFPVVAKNTNAGLLQVTIPPDLPLRASSRPNLIVSARRESGARVEVKESLQIANSVYVAHLATDKPMYQPGETIHYRALVMDRFSLRPAQSDFSLQFYLVTPLKEQKLIGQGNGRISRLEKPGELLSGPDGKPLTGLGAGNFQITPDAPGGEYTLLLKDSFGRFPEQARKFIVNRYQKPRINKELDFHRKTYAPGQDLKAYCKASSADGKPLANSVVSSTFSVDGVPMGVDGKPNDKPAVFQTDSEGRVALKYRLPNEIVRGASTLSVTFQDGGNTETISKPVPLVLDKIQMEFFPEGGDMVAGLPTRVYFHAQTLLGRPAEVTGRILENGKVIIPEVKTLSDDTEPGINQGMGRFELTPGKDAKYEFEVTKPESVRQKFSLQSVKDSGVVMHLGRDFYRAGEKVDVQVRSTTKSRLMVGMYCRGRLLESAYLDDGNGSCLLNPQDPIGGVCRLTVFEEKVNDANTKNLYPVSERLFYRQPSESLRLEMVADKSAYVPGDKASLKILAKNENSNPVDAVIMLGVVDNSVVVMADEKTHRSMPTHFLLTTEVRKAQDLEYADVLLGDHPKAGMALDLLLGTQGWRRFAEQDPVKFREIHEEEANNLLVTIGQASTVSRDLSQAPLEKLNADYQPKISRATELENEAREHLQKLQAAESFLISRAHVSEWKELFRNLIQIAAVVLILGFFVTALFVMIRAVMQAAYGKLALGMCLGGMGLVLVFLIIPASVGERFHFVGGMAPMKNAVPAAALEFADANAIARDVAPQAMALPPNARRMDVRPAEKMQAMGGPAGIPQPGVPVPRMLAANAKAENRNNFGNAAMVEKQNMAPLFREPMVARDGFKGLREAQDRLAGDINAAEGAAFARKKMPLESGPMIVREYAHKRTSGDQPDVRTDFTETIAWFPALVTKDGSVTTAFELNDSVTSFVASASGYTLDGRLGSARLVFSSRLPLVIQPKVPQEVTHGDEIIVPLAITNNTDTEREAQILLEKYSGLKLLNGTLSSRVKIGKGETIRKLYTFTPSLVEGDAELVFSAKIDGFASDSIREGFKISNAGFPIVRGLSDTLEGTLNANLQLPEKILPGSLKVHVIAYPSVLADLQKGLESMLREPHGCFEQTSTTNYPNLLVMDYLRESNQSLPDVEKKAMGLLERGYQKLISFECNNQAKGKREGYEWFGGNAAPHEALTAYGLLQFRDLSRVMPVNQTMIRRTADYLMSQRDGKGGFNRNPRALDSFGRAPEEITNAYIVWSITESGKEDDLTLELKSLKEKAEQATDVYFLSLVANSLLNRGDAESASKIIRKIVSKQRENGCFEGEKTSITGSGGNDLKVETTALALLAMLKANHAEFHVPARKSAEWISKQRGGQGGFGSTQATIMALKSLIAFTKANKRDVQAGSLKVFAGDTEVVRQDFSKDHSQAISLEVSQPEKHFHSGENKLRLELSGGNNFPVSVGWTYHSEKPASEGKPILKLQTKLAKVEIEEGAPTQCKMVLENARDSGQGMTTAILGIPAGLALPEDLKQLRELCKVPEDGSRPKLAAFEVLGRELVLYWRDLAPSEKIELDLDLIARVPGEYKGQASRAYLYYDATKKDWVSPVSVKVLPKVAN